MSNPKPAKPRKINLTIEERAKWETLLVEYYSQAGIESPSFKQFRESPEGKACESPVFSFVTKIVDECEAGWPKAPKDIKRRIELKTQWNTPARAKKSAKQQSTIVEKAKDKRLSISMDIKSYLTEEEQEFFSMRLNKYIDDFDFNDSSDMPLVERLIIEEIMHKRLIIMQLNSVSGIPQKIDADIINDSLNDVHKRIMDLQKQLGISRMQRSDELNKGYNSIAEMAANLDDKLKKFPELRQKLHDEEQTYYSAKALEEPINVIPGRVALSQ
jgi:hypothetical protein